MSLVSPRHLLHRLGTSALMLSVVGVILGTLPLQRSLAEPGDQPKTAGTSGAEVTAIQALAEKQKKTGERYHRFEAVLLRLAKLTAKSDPQRAALLKKAIAQSKQDSIGVQFERVSELLAKERWGDSVARQGELKQDLEKLLELLVGDQAEKDRQNEIRTYLKWLNDRIKEQTELQGRTANAGDPQSVAGDQGKTAEKTGQLAKAIKAADDARKAGGPGKGNRSGQGGDGQPAPGGHEDDQPEDETPGRQRIAAAEEKMRRAQQELEKARRENALEPQEKALDDLKVAKAELEQILRQLREEEIERMLAILEVRFRKMLEMQVAVYEGTLLLERVPSEQRGRSYEVESGRLSRRESQIVIDCNKALTLLKEEGSGVALPMVLEQVRDDMETVVVRLAQDKVDPITQSIEEDIIDSLEKLIAALQKAQQDLEEKGPKPDGPVGPTGEPGDQPLIERLAELKMIREMQLQVNDRTQRFAKMVQGEQADKPTLLEALQKLAERERKIQRSTRDISLGRNR